MTELNRRELIAAIAAVAAVSSVPVTAKPGHAAYGAIDLSSGTAIGEAYLAANPQVKLSSLMRAHLPRGVDRSALQRLKQRSASDFRAGRVFIHQGWHLSRTEAELFALLTLGRS